MKSYLTIVILVSSLLTSEAHAADILTCTGNVTDLLQNPHPVEINLEKQDPSGYILNYTGPGHSRAGDNSKITASLKKGDYYQVAYTTGSYLRIILNDEAVFSPFVLEVSFNRLNGQTLATFSSGDGKASYSVTGLLTCY